MLGEAVAGDVATDAAADVATDATAVFLAEHNPGASLGPALAIAARANAAQLHVFAPGESVADQPALDTLFRRAALFTYPITIWSVAGANATPAEAPTQRPPEPPPPRVPELVALLQQAGADVNVEHGVITGEVQGLEIARVVADAAGLPESASESPGQPANPADPNQQTQSWRLEVGVGAHDREAFAMLHGNEPILASLQRVVDLLKRHRSPGAEPHPLNRMAAARWLRALLIGQPDLVGAKRLTAASPPVARDSVTDKAPAVCYGVDEHNKSLVVVASVGIDLDLVPFAADARAFLDDSAQLVIAVPRRDAHQLLSQIAAWLDPEPEPVRIARLPDDWMKTGAGT